MMEPGEPITEEKHASSHHERGHPGKLQSPSLVLPRLARIPGGQDQQDWVRSMQMEEVGTRSTSDKRGSPRELSPDERLEVC